MTFNTTLPELFSGAKLQMLSMIGIEWLFLCRFFYVTESICSVIS